MVRPTEDNLKPRSKNRLYLRMFLYALIGFVLFFVSAWIRLAQVVSPRYESNPYAGPPPLLICLLIGGIGIVLGAAVSLFKRKD